MAKASDVSTLSPELAMIAANELGENPASRVQAIAEFRRRLNEVEEQKQDDRTLLRFLRCKKFDVSRALSVYEGYHAFREDHTELFTNTSSESVKEIWRAGIIGGLSCRDRKGRAVMVSFPGRWEPESHGLEDTMKALTQQLEHLIKSEETQINGIVLIADFSNFSLYQARSIRPWYFQYMAALVQNAFPARFKGVYILNQPWYISFLLTIIRQFLSEKMIQRINILGEDTDMLSEHFDMSSLPEELGGEQPPYDGCQWIRTITALPKNTLDVSSHNSPHTSLRLLESSV